MDVVAHKSRNAEGEPESRENHGHEEKPAPLGERRDAEKGNAEREAGLSHVELIVAEVEAVVVLLEVLGGLFDFLFLRLVLFGFRGVFRNLALESRARVVREIGLAVA